MLFSFCGLLLFVLGLGILWISWKIKIRYIGTDNRHKWFADYYKDFPIFHTAKTLPMKKKLFESLHDLAQSRKGLRLLEIGVGPGANLQFYPENTQLTTVDPNPYFKAQLLKNLEKYPHVTLDRYVVTGAENMKDIPDNSVDAVVSTIVLCSCEQVMQVYQEICRVLTPGGKFYFMEHVIDDKAFSLMKFLQILLSRLGVWQFLFDGCRTDKDIENELNRGGFTSVSAKRFRLDLSEKLPLAMLPVRLITPHLYGTATAP